MKTFLLIDGQAEMVIKSPTPRQAALMAAARGFTSICLLEMGKLHIFTGSRQEISERNPYEIYHSITYRPVCSKVAYHTVGNMKRTEIMELCQILI